MHIQSTLSTTKLSSDSLPRHNLENNSVPTDITSIFMPTEYRLANGKPYTGKSDLNYIFNHIIDVASQDRINIHINRQVVLSADFAALLNAEMLDRLFANIDNQIHYEFLAESDVTDLESVKRIMDNIIVNLTNAVDPNTGITINHLCITKKSLSDIAGYIDKYINKLYRNLNQLIRVKRDWRLYGPGATIYGNYLTTGSAVNECTTVPAECFKQYGAGYIAGAKPYGVETELTKVVEYWQEKISPDSVFTAQEHVHSVTVSANVPDINVTNIGPWAKKLETEPTTEQQTHALPYDNFYSKLDVTVISNPDGSYNRRGLWYEKDKTRKAVGQVVVTVRYDNGKKYLMDSGTDVSSTNVVLPAFGTYMWQWVTDDTTTF